MFAHKNALDFRVQNKEKSWFKHRKVDWHGTKMFNEYQSHDLKL